MSSVLDGTDPRALGERLRIARTNAGIRQERASEALGVSRPTLVAIEKGHRRVRAEELAAAAGLYGVSVGELLRPARPMPDVAARFRAMPGSRDEDRMEAAALLAGLAASEVELERMLGRSLRTNYPPERPLGPGDAEEQARDAALDLRHRLGLGLAPVRDTLALIGGEMGVRVFVDRKHLKGSLSGAYVYAPEIGASILLNGVQSRRRRKMTAWHEVGHMVVSREVPDAVGDAPGAHTREERFARHFALEFLAPASAVRTTYDVMRREAGRFGYRQLLKAADRFDLSTEAMCRRLEEMGLFRRGQWDTLRDSGFREGDARAEYGLPGPDVGEDACETPMPRLHSLGAEAYRRGLVSEGALARMLRIERVALRRMLNTVGAEIEEDDLALAPG